MIRIGNVRTGKLPGLGLGLGSEFREAFRDVRTTAKERVQAQAKAGIKSASEAAKASIQEAIPLPGAPGGAPGEAGPGTPGLVPFANKNGGPPVAMPGEGPTSAAPEPGTPEHEEALDALEGMIDALGALDDPDPTAVAYVEGLAAVLGVEVGRGDLDPVMWAKLRGRGGIIGATVGQGQPMPYDYDTGQFGQVGSYFQGGQPVPFGLQQVWSLRPGQYTGMPDTTGDEAEHRAFEAELDALYAEYNAAHPSAAGTERSVDGGFDPYDTLHGVNAYGTGDYDEGVGQGQPLPFEPGAGFLGLGRKEREHAEWQRQQEEEGGAEAKKRSKKKAAAEEEASEQERAEQELAHKIKMAKLQKQAAEAGVDAGESRAAAAPLAPATSGYTRIGNLTRIGRIR